MLKGWKQLFVKTDTTATKAGKEEATDAYSFPVSNPIVTVSGNTDHTGYTAPPVVSDPVVNEVIEVYEAGLESINMPGYDFYEFYKAISTTGAEGAHSYQLAFNMAKSMDKTLTVQKLLNDAEFYISKINEVHGQYVNQGQAKLQSLEQKKQTDKGQLQGEIDQHVARIAQLRAELQQLELAVNHKKGMLSKIDEGFTPQEKNIREKLQANDAARNASIEKLNKIRNGIATYIKL
jgi:hypothetical protein